MEGGASQVLLGISCRNLFVLPPSVQGLIDIHVLFGPQGSTESCNTTTEDEDLKGRCCPWRGRAHNCDPGASVLIGLFCPWSWDWRLLTL